MLLLTTVTVNSWPFLATEIASLNESGEYPPGSPEPNYYPSCGYFKTLG